mmetsp:Transcript_24692/g.57964  ORF Transcript_24692/g.57964 Transcript_24692/m.57964 type:complete len:85 (-) Transcript_24692:803-1057(-)
MEQTGTIPFRADASKRWHGNDAGNRASIGGVSLVISFNRSTQRTRCLGIKITVAPSAVAGYEASKIREEASAWSRLAIAAVAMI